MNPFKQMCLDKAGTPHVLQGNIAFAVGCVRAGIHAVDGYPGTPSTEVIDKGLSHALDLIDANWSVNEAVAAGVGHGHSLAGRDCVVTLKIPGLFQAADVVTSASQFTQKRGGLIYYLASDFVPNSTQHVIDPRYTLKSCFIPVIEPRNHQEMHEAASKAVKIAREHNTSVVILANGNLCHSEGLITLMEKESREPVEMDDVRGYNCLPNLARPSYDAIQTVRMPALGEMVETSDFNQWIRGAGKKGVITHGVNTLYMEEYKALFDGEIDILSLAYTNPLPMELIKKFCASIDGDVYVVEDGFRFIHGACLEAGLDVKGKPENSCITEWSPRALAEFLGNPIEAKTPEAAPVPRPPMICAGCPYALFAQVVSRMKRRGKLEALFGDIGCNSLLYFLNALDTGVAMGASESKRTGFVSSRPDMASKCISVIGDSTECHSGMDATRNAIYRNSPGVKVVLDNQWTAMTGGQNSPASPVNFHGDANAFDLVNSLKGEGARVVEIDAYDYKGIRDALKDGLKQAETGEFTLLVIQGTCIRRVPKSDFGQKLVLDTDKCKACGHCNICSGIELNADTMPQWNNLCSGCVSKTPACLQVCPTGAISIAHAQGKTEMVKPAAKAIETAPEEVPMPQLPADLPQRLSLCIRGVGGQGNLFFGKVLAQMAFLAGYAKDNIVKGETHGMAQMGGPVISTFGCGKVFSPALVPGSADCLIAMEKSEILRPEFLSSLKPGGTILMAETRIVPQGLPETAYPGDAALAQALEGYELKTVDVLETAIELGDASGRSANVVMLGALSTLPPMAAIPMEIWLNALKNVSPKPAIWNANYAAFMAGRDLA
ncbi:MAG: 2-oxoacid:acceptor oxidoreductase family protein [Desulfobacterales bacterium]|nr:2-oxoacid:acceptor oxidoreductase family protein [Desulfobacterales bacterium]